MKHWVSDVTLAWQERVVDRVRGRRRCARLPLILADPSLSGRPVARDLDQILRIVVGRRLTRSVMGDHPTRQSVTDFFERGALQAEQLKAYVRPTDTLLEYGGGIGRIGHAMVPHVHRLVSVDLNPLMKAYGPHVSPGIDFRNLEELPEVAEFDGAYSIAVFFHLPLERQRLALDYVHRRLKPGGWFLVDLMLGPRTPEPITPYGPVRATALEDFRGLYEPLFSARRVPLFNSGFLLRKRDAVAAPSPPVDGRFAVNDASIVFDVLEGETVVVNLDSGTYYILQGTASAIWQMLAAGRTVPEVVATLSRVCTPGTVSIQPAVSDFVEQLTQEALLIPATGQEALPAFDESQLGASGQAFAVPVMFRYTDMQALIQMDPIREYDETGWPRRRVPAP